MKRIICLITVLCLVFGSFSFCFATAVDWNSSDSNHLTEIRNTLMSGGAIYNLISAVNSNVILLNSNLVTLMGWLDPGNGGSTVTILNKILSVLSYTDAAGGLKSWLADVYQLNYTSDFYLQTLKTIWDGVTVYPESNTYTKDSTSPTVSALGMPLYAALVYMLNQQTNNNAKNYTYTNDKMYENSESIQTFTNWATLNNSTFSPVSGVDGIYKWLSNIQTPVARLSYVLASDERIEAQEAAAANEEAVVDNFIDSTGDGSTSPSDIGSISALSSGYKSNFGSDASVSGIFNIFNSNNMNWFSQETANQLDTTTPTRRGSSFETPLLDQQIEDIYDQIGVKHD